MKKILKCLLWTFLSLLGLALLLVLTLPLWVNLIVPGILNSYFPGKLGVDFHLESFHLNPYAGTMSVDQLVVGNPKGCSSAHALELGEFSVDLGMMTVFSDLIEIEDMRLNGLSVTYENGSGRVKNVDTIFANAGWDSKDTKKKKEIKNENPEESESETHLLVRHLVISNVKIKIHGVPISLPDLTLENIGGKTGITYAQLYDIIADAILGAASKVVGGIKELGKLGVDLGDKGIKLGERGIDLGTKAIDRGAEELKKGTEGLKKGAEGLKKGAEGVKKGATAVVDTTKETLGKSVDKLGEGAGRTVEAVGNLLNFKK